LCDRLDQAEANTQCLADDPRLKPDKEGQAGREVMRRFIIANAHGKLEEVARIFDPNP